MVVGVVGVGHPNVHYLNLMNNDIGDEGAEAIGELLKENDGIVEMVHVLCSRTSSSVVVTLTSVNS